MALAVFDRFLYIHIFGSLRIHFFDVLRFPESQDHSRGRVRIWDFFLFKSSSGWHGEHGMTQFLQERFRAVFHYMGEESAIRRVLEFTYVHWIRRILPLHVYIAKHGDQEWAVMIHVGTFSATSEDVAFEDSGPGPADDLATRVFHMRNDAEFHEFAWSVGIRP